MRLSLRKLAAASVLLVVSMSIATVAFADDPPAFVVKPFSTTVYPSELTLYWLDVLPNPAFLGQQALLQQFKNAAEDPNRRWNCADPKNYSVTAAGGKSLRVEAVVLNDPIGGCARFIQYLVGFRLLIPYSTVDSKVTVKILNMTDGAGQSLTIASGPVQVTWRPTILTASLQSVPNENLNNKTIDQKGVEQASLKGTFFPRKTGNDRGGLYVDTNDLFSTNERDTKSAFLGGLGYQIAISKTWYSPLKFEGQMQGNQVATNLSSVLLAGVETALPWGWTGQLTGNEYVGHPLSPEFVLGLPYTHRINQVVAANAKPLPVDDFAVNPALAFGNGTILHKLCLHSSSTSDTPTTQSGFCMGWEADLGLWYLPLQKTSKGSQRAEGYWDYSFLIPLSNFAKIPLVALDTQSQQMQLRIEYADSVSAANNYARSKKWTFGVELTKKK